MPTYEYVCDVCGAHFEQFQQMTEEALTKCPECGGRVRRLIGTGSGIIFKGSGFYETDYKRKAEKKPEGKASSCDGGSDSCKSCPMKKKDE